MRVFWLLRAVDRLILREKSRKKVFNLITTFDSSIKSHVPHTESRAPDDHTCLDHCWAVSLGHSRSVHRIPHHKGSTFLRLKSDHPDATSTSTAHPDPHSRRIRREVQARHLLLYVQRLLFLIFPRCILLMYHVVASFAPDCVLCDVPNRCHVSAQGTGDLCAYVLLYSPTRIPMNGNDSVRPVVRLIETVIFVWNK